MSALWASSIHGREAPFFSLKPKSARASVDVGTDDVAQRWLSVGDAFQYHPVDADVGVLFHGNAVLREPM